MGRQPPSSLHDSFPEIDEEIIDWVIDRKHREGRSLQDAKDILKIFQRRSDTDDHQVLEALATTFPLIQASVVASVLEQCRHDSLDAARCLLGLVNEGNLDYDEDTETQAARAYQSRPVTGRTKNRQERDDHDLARALQESEQDQYKNMGRGKKSSKSSRHRDDGSDDSHKDEDDSAGEAASDSGSAIAVKATFGGKPTTARTNDSEANNDDDDDDDDDNDDDDDEGEEEDEDNFSRGSASDLIKVKAHFGKKPAMIGSIDSLDMSARKRKSEKKKKGRKSKYKDEEEEENEGDEGDEDVDRHTRARRHRGDNEDEEDEEEEEEEEEDDDEDDDGDDGGEGKGFVGDYDPNDYQDLDVSEDVKEIFQYVTAYKPLTLDLHTKLDLFIPEFIPAVGDIDPFLQIPPPVKDKVKELNNLGLKFVNEPAGHQSDPVILDLQFRDSSKRSGIKQLVVHSISDASEKKTAIKEWMNNVEILHSDRPHAEVIYDKVMPEMESMMQAWPPNVEEVLNQLHLPSAEIDVDLKNYARLVCAVLDIPVHKKCLIQSLHVLFSLYSDFTNSQHFANKKRSEILTRLQDGRHGLKRTKSPLLTNHDGSSS